MLWVDNLKNSSQDLLWKICSKGRRLSQCSFHFLLTPKLQEETDLWGGANWHWERVFSLFTCIWGLKIIISGNGLAGSSPSPSPSAGSVPGAQQQIYSSSPEKLALGPWDMVAGDLGDQMCPAAHKGGSRPGPEKRITQIPLLWKSHSLALPVARVSFCESCQVTRPPQRLCFNLCCTLGWT